MSDKPREACGIVAVSGHEAAARLAFLGLYALQHRGQESAGIVSVDPAGKQHTHKGMGLVADVFDDQTLGGLQGDIALGHVRYSTTGQSSLQNAQPIVVDYRGQPLLLAHNGTLTNAPTLRARLAADGSIFQTGADSEILIHLIARSRRQDFEGKLDDALSQVTGAFSIILVLGNTIFAARDPRGFRPLVLGEVDGAPVIASETCALDILNGKYLREVGAGEVLRVKNGEVESLRPLAPQEPSACLFELVYFARPDSRVWGCSVDEARRAFGRQLAKEHPADADCVLAVPDSSNSAALGYSEVSGLPFELALIRNHYVGRTFIHPTQRGRDFKVRVKYNPVRELVNGRRLVVVDDSLVRGTTSRGLVRILRECGAKEVHFRVASPPVLSPCYYGIDMPTRGELIGSRLPVDGIREHLAVDTLGYLSLEGMKASVVDYGPFCDSCWTGDYSQEPIETMAQ